jgi:hypothetical protein
VYAPHTTAGAGVSYAVLSYSSRRPISLAENFMAKRAGNQTGNSDDSQKIIADLTRAIEELVSRRKKPEELEGIIAEAKTLAREWKDPQSAEKPKDRRRLFDETSNNTTFLLAALVAALRPDHELVKQIRRHFPNELQKLSDESLFADLMAAARIWASTQPQPTAKKKSERKRRRWRRNHFGSIEYQFGGAAEAERRKFSLSALGDSHYEPTCLDDIFAGETVNMLRLEELFFGIDRHRLSNALQGVQKRRYDYRAVAKIMETLLSERSRRKRKRRGRSPRNRWLDDPDDPDRRMRVLNGIIAQINRLSVHEKIANEFLTVIRPRLADSGKK